MKTNWLFRLFLASLCLLAWGVTGSAVYADGDETLGAPSIAIADGSAVLAAGVGLVSQPGTINLDVPAGATVQQALLYWQGRDNASAPAPTDTISVNGGPVNGDLIGVSDLSGLLLGSIPLDPWGSISYRADITGMIGTGANALTIDGLTFATRNDGASVVVIVDDGTSAFFQLRDGNDFVSWDLRSENGVVTNYDPFGAAVVQTFSFAGANSDRTADLLIIAGDAVASRRDEVEIIVNGTIINLTDVAVSGDGAQWDTLSIPVTIPAGATSISVELISPDPEGDNPDSLSWVTAGLTVPIPFCGDGIVDPEEFCDDSPDDVPCDGCFNCQPERCGDGNLCENQDETCEPPGEPAGNFGNMCRDDCTFCGDGIVDPGEECDPAAPDAPAGCLDDCTIEMGGEGCTPGYWRQRQHFDSWPNPPYDPALTTFEEAFGRVITVRVRKNRENIKLTDPSLRMALKAKGGGINALARHAAAALLNAASADVNYASSLADVIAMVQDAIDSGDYGATKDTLADWNEGGCPLN